MFGGRRNGDAVRLEYLSNIPLLRLFDFTPDEAAQLGAAVADLASGRAERVAVHGLPGVMAVGGCELVFRLRGWGQAVVRVGPTAFACGFTAGTWDNVAGLIEPFAAGAGGFQWLAGVPGEANLLLSDSG
jgi:hypothetical protein